MSNTKKGEKLLDIPSSLANRVGLSDATVEFKLRGYNQGFRGGYGEFEFENLKANTKYKVLVPNENFVAPKSGNVRTSSYYDITGFCFPRGRSRYYNNFVNRLITGSNRRLISNSKYGYSWGGDDFLSDDDGELELRIFWHGLWRRGNFNRSGLYTQIEQSLTESPKSDLIVLPVSELTDAGGGVFTINSGLSTNPDPVIFGSPGYLHPGPAQTYQEIPFEFIQTFDLDVNKLDNVDEVDISDITLFFKAKPDAISNASGIQSPGVTIFLVDVDNGQPVVTSQYSKSIKKMKYGNITASSDASVGTTFAFSDPISLKTGRQYGIVIDLEDPGYILWDCKSGDRTLGTNDASPGAKKDYRGGLFEYGNSDPNSQINSAFKNRPKTELKFEIHAAEYDVSTNIDLIINNDEDEFLTVDTITAPTGGGLKFFAGEIVYVSATAQTGTVSITAGTTDLIGVGTDFTALTDDEVIVLIDTGDPTKVEVVQIGDSPTASGGGLESATLVKVGEPVMNTIAGTYIRTTTAEVTNFAASNSRLYLTESTANSTRKIMAGNTIIGTESGVSANVVSLDKVPISAFSTSMDMKLPTNYKVSGTYSFANSTNGMTAPATLDLFRSNLIANNTAYILSRSLEVANLSGAKSANIALQVEYTGPQDLLSFETPTININDVNISSTQWVINNDSTNEHTAYGNSASKHISRMLTFGEGNAAEDIRVIYNSYRPPGTDVLCFAKIINSEDPEPIGDKSWTKLELKSANEFSVTNQYDDFREYEFGFPSFPPTDRTLVGTANTALANSTVNGAGTTFTSDLADGDVIRIYDPLFPDENYGIFSIASVDSDTAITLSTPVSNNNIVADAGLKIDKLTTPNTAFNNKENLNIVRYFGSTGEIYDTYSGVVIKTVMLSTSSVTVPKINDYRVIGVSA